MYHVMAENDVNGDNLLRHFHDLSPGNHCLVCVNEDVLFSNVVTTFNNVYNLATTEEGAIYFSNASSITVRYNNVWGPAGSFFNPTQAATSPNFTNLEAKIYFNNVYQSGSTTFSALMAFYPDHTWTLPQEVTDNVVYDTRADARVVYVPMSDFQSAASFIDRNQWYFPNDTGGAGPSFQNSNDGSMKTFTQWNAFLGVGSIGFDVNGCVKNPNWTDPANGDFTPTSPNPC